MLCIGEGPKYRPFRDLRSVSQAGRPREQVENHRTACTQVLFLWKAELGFFHVSEIVIGWLVPSVGQKHPSRAWLVCTFHHRRSRLLKTGFFRLVRELKIQRKNPGSALRQYEACFPRLLENCIYVIVTACPFIVLTKLDKRELIIRF